MTRPPIVLLIAAVTIVSLAGTPAPARAGNPPMTVNTTADTPDADPQDFECLDANDKCSLRAGVQQANFNSGPDTLIVPAGVYTLTIPGMGENDAETGDIDIDTHLSVEGEGPGVTVFNAAGLDRFFDVIPGWHVELAGVTVQNGNSGGAGTFGGAIRSGVGTEEGGTFTLDDVVIQDNQGGSGGGVAAQGSIEATDTVFRRNTALGEGGALFASGSGGTAVLTNVEIYENEAGLYGGARLGAASNRVTGSVVRDNTALAAGGLGVLGTTEVMSSTISGNTATGTGPFDGFGGGIYVANAPLTLRDSTVRDNEATREGGGLMVLEQIDNAANISMDNVTFDSNAAGEGGAVRAGGGTSAGGGHITATNSTFSNNEARDGNGGAIDLIGTHRVAQLNLFNVTLSDNAASANGGALAVSAANAAALLSHVTIADNAADQDSDNDGGGGGIFQAGGASVTLRNSIVHGNVDRSAPGHHDCSGTITAQERNIVGDTTGCNLNGGQLIAGDPELELLAHNGGPTQTRALGPTSAAIDMAEACPPPITDQRGIERPQGEGCDLGAYEVVEGLLWGDNDCSQTLSDADALTTLLFVANVAPLTAEALTPCPALGGELTPGSPSTLYWGDVDCSGEVGPLDAILILAELADSDPGIHVPEACPPLNTVLQFN